jgi:hypothetical protein
MRGTRRLTISFKASEEYYYKLERAIFCSVVNRPIDRLFAWDIYFSITVYIQIYNIICFFIYVHIYTILKQKLSDSARLALRFVLLFLLHLHS